MNPDFATGAFMLAGVCGTPLVIPLVFGSIILKYFWKDEISRLTGFLTLKATLTFLVVLRWYGISVINPGIPFF